MSLDGVTGSAMVNACERLADKIGIATLQVDAGAVVSGCERQVGNCSIRAVQGDARAVVTPIAMLERGRP